MFWILFKASGDTWNMRKVITSFFSILFELHRVTYSEIKSLMSLDDIAGFATLGGGFLTI